MLQEDGQKVKDTVRRLRKEKQESEDFIDRCEEKVRSMTKEKYRYQDEKEELERQIKQLQKQLKEKSESERNDANQ